MATRSLRRPTGSFRRAASGGRCITRCAGRQGVLQVGPPPAAGRRVSCCLPVLCAPAAYLWLTRQHAVQGEEPRFWDMRQYEYWDAAAGRWTPEQPAACLVRGVANPPDWRWRNGSPRTAADCKEFYCIYENLWCAPASSVPDGSGSALNRMPKAAPGPGLPACVQPRLLLVGCLVRAMPPCADYTALSAALTCRPPGVQVQQWQVLPACRRFKGSGERCRRAHSIAGGCLCSCGWLPAALQAISRAQQCPRPAALNLKPCRSHGRCRATRSST